VINDVWMALKLSSGNFFSWMFILWGILIFFGSAVEQTDTATRTLVGIIFTFQ
jgi:hypothetical protein